MTGKTDQASIFNGSDHCLAYPPDGICAKPIATIGIKIRDTVHEADIPLLYKIQKAQLHIATQITSSDAHDQAVIGFDELTPRLLSLNDDLMIRSHLLLLCQSTTNRSSQVLFLLGCQQRNVFNLVQIHNDFVRQPLAWRMRDASGEVLLRKMRSMCQARWECDHFFPPSVRSCNQNEKSSLLLIIWVERGKKNIITYHFSYHLKALS